MSPAPRRPRRAVRPSGTVGTDESVLRSSVPGPSSPTDRPSSTGTGRSVAATQGAATSSSGAPGATEDLWRATRSADDSDQGWGRSEPTSNDERLLREKPPHW